MIIISLIENHNVRKECNLHICMSKFFITRRLHEHTWVDYTEKEDR